MDFFKKRSTAWAVLMITIVLCSFWGIRKRPSDTKDIELLPSGVYVQDKANILSDETEDYITKLNNGLVSETSSEIQVITIDTTGDDNLWNTAWNYGYDLNLSKTSSVFIIAVNDGDALVLQGDGLFSDYYDYFSDDRLGKILKSNYTVQDFADKNLDRDTKAAFTALIGQYEQAFNVSIEPASQITKYPEQTYNEYRAGEGYMAVLVSYIIIMLVLLLIIVAISNGRRRRRRRILYGYPTPRPMRRSVFVPSYYPGSTRPPRQTPPPRGGSLRRQSQRWIWQFVKPFRRFIRLVKFRRQSQWRIWRFVKPFRRFIRLVKFRRQSQRRIRRLIKPFRRFIRRRKIRWQL